VNSRAEELRYRAEAKRFAEAALKLDSENPEALFVMALGYDTYGQWAKQEPWFERAMAADLLTRARYAIMLLDVGRIREALDHSLRQFGATGAVNSATRAARILAAYERLFEARRLYDRARRTDPVEVARHELLTAIWYGAISEAQRMLAERGESLQLSEAQAACYRSTLSARRGERVDSADFIRNCGFDAYFCRDFSPSREMWMRHSGRPSEISANDS